jgi:hypothetical protein
MNERGEVTTLSCFLIVSFMAMVTLCALELKRSFRYLEKRTHLYLCVKETKGELEQFLNLMGRSNWGIKNLQRVSLISAIIPGAQAASMEAQKLKKYLQYFQDANLLSYVNKINGLRSKNCALDPRIYLTPYKLGPKLFARDEEGAAVLREPEWTYAFFSKPYFISVKVNATKQESLRPKIEFETSDKLERLSFPSSSF